MVLIATVKRGLFIFSGVRGLHCVCNAVCFRSNNIKWNFFEYLRGRCRAPAARLPRAIGIKPDLFWHPSLLPVGGVFCDGKMQTSKRAGVIPLHYAQLPPMRGSGVSFRRG